MEQIALLLFVSVIFNVLFLRWALQEHALRRQWQKEATALQRALRSLNDGQSSNAQGGINWIIWLAGALIMSAMALTLMIF